MRTTFHGYFPLTAPEQERLLREALIVLDTSAILNLYRYTPKSRNELLSALLRLSDRLWIPHHVGVEFHSRRLELISHQHRVGEKMASILNAAMRTLEGQFGEFSTNAVIDTKKILDPIRSQFQKLSDEIAERGKRTAKEYGIDLRSDQLVERIASLYEDRVGRQYGDEELRKIYAEGELRYEKKIPPGYLDRNKDAPERFGDLVVWRQLIEHAKEVGSDVIFVTDDAKEDWWWRVEGQTIGPRPELRAEFYSLTGKTYYSYRVERFVALLGERPGSDVSAEAVAEVRKTSANLDRVSHNRRHLAELMQRRDAITERLVKLDRQMRELEVVQRDAQQARVSLAEAERRQEVVKVEILRLDDRIAYLRGRVTATIGDNERLDIEANLQESEKALIAASAEWEVAAQRVRDAQTRVGEAQFGGDRSLFGAAALDRGSSDAARMRSELRYLDATIAVIVQSNAEDE